MRIKCPICSTAIDADDALKGQKGRCATCSTKFIIPLNAFAAVKVLEGGRPASAPTESAQPAGPKLNVGSAPPKKRALKAPAMEKPGKSARPEPGEPVDEAAASFLAKGSGAAKQGEAPKVLRTSSDKSIATRPGLKVRSSEAKESSPGVAIAMVSVCLLLLFVGIMMMSGGGDKAAGKVAEVVEEEVKLPSPVKAEILPEPPSVDLPEPDPVARGGLADFDKVVHPVIEKYCVSCHDGVSEEGGVDMERLHSERLASTEVDIWEKAAVLVEMEEMPPRTKKKQPTKEERELLIAWIKTVSERWDAGEFGRDPGRTTIRRLNKNEYNYTIRDLLGLKLRPADEFPAESSGEAGFDNNADALFLPPLLMENLVESAGIVVHTVYRNQVAYQKYLFAHPGGETTPTQAARKVLRHWASLAYRRPVSEGELERLVTIVSYGMEEKKRDYKTAMKGPLLAILISPNFLYRAEKLQQGNEAYRVDQFDLASRLSYFLWSSMPDAELFGLAKNGQLDQPAVIDQQVKRMLADDRAKALSMHFAGQWFGWEKLRSTTNPDRKKFPMFDFDLRVAMYRESSIFFENLVRDNGRITELLDSNYTYLNGRLAQHYGIKGVTGTAFQRVSLKDRNRGGVIGMGSVLASTSLPLRSSPSVRGAYVLTEILGTPPPAPPMDVPQLPEDDRAIVATTFRQTLEQHAFIPNCKGCHSRIDPLGFGLENFDAIGRWRTQANGKPLDTKGILPDGTVFNSPASLKRVLMQKRELFTRNMVEKTLSYALGRELSAYDRQTVRSITDKVIAADYRIHTLFTEIARSYPFIHCRGDDFTPK